MNSKFIKFLIACAAAILILWVFYESEPVESVDGKDAALPIVSFVAVKPKAMQSSIGVTGIVKSRWPVALTANVRGQLINSYEALLPGSLVHKGDVLAQINDVEYAALLARAKAEESAAKLELERILNEQSVAKRIDEGAVNSDYRLYKPHVQAAQASLQAAKANVAAALQQLKDTKISAPFDAIILAKHIAPSQQINTGEAVYTLASSQALDVEVSLSNQQWQSAAISPYTRAAIIDVFNQKYQADVRYLEPVVNNQTRQRGLVLTTDEPYKTQTSLLPEQQVEVVFSTKLIENAVVTAATVLTRDNKVWSIAQQKLVLEPVNVIEERADSVMFSFVEQPSLPRQVVLYPLSTMLVGQAVKPKLVSSLQGE